MDDSSNAAPPPDPANEHQVSVDSGWPRPNSDGVDYFIEEDFRWNLDHSTLRDAINIGPSERSAATGAGSSTTLARSSSDCGGGGGGMNPSVSSSSSEDPAEKSPGRPPEIIPPSCKARKKCQKRIRQPRFAFVTKSEVDHLEDGYRWRKYGQKAVKNSPFPRSYYRCTNSKCAVKKRVERSSEDPTTVITTYEGQHCHHAVGFHRAGFVSHESLLAAGQFSPFYYAGGVHELHREVAPGIPQYSQQQPTNSSDVGSGYQMLPHQLQQPHPTDEGLLGDMVPPGMRI